jgi:hypothetical protein
VLELHGLPRCDGEQRTVGSQQLHQHVAARAHGLALLENISHVEHARVPAGVHGGNGALSLHGDDAGKCAHLSLIALALARSTGFIKYDSTVFLPVRMSTCATIPGMIGRLSASPALRVRRRTR